MQIKEGDFVSISGEVTGYGNLDGYVDKVYNSFGDIPMVEVTYTSESRIIANGDVGIHCRTCFCKPLLY